MLEITAAQFTEGLRFVAGQVEAKGACDVDLRAGADWISLSWQDGPDQSNPADVSRMSSALRGLAERVEQTGAQRIFILQENGIRTVGGRVQFTGARRYFARWQWGVSVETLEVSRV
jgi:hypothetical protein